VEKMPLIAVLIKY